MYDTSIRSTTFNEPEKIDEDYPFYEDIQDAVADYEVAKESLSPSNSALFDNEAYSFAYHGHH